MKSQLLPDGDDGRYGQESDICGNCTNAPFVYAFSVGNSRLCWTPCVFLFLFQSDQALFANETSTKIVLLFIRALEN